MRRNAQRIMSVLGAAFALVVAAGACGGDPEQAGIVEIPPEEAVQVRVLTSLTGASALGVAVQRGVELAVRDFHRVHGHEIETGAPLDSRCLREGGEDAAREVVADTRVLGIVGTACSGAAVGASPVVSGAGLVMISPSNTSPALTSNLAGTANADHHPGYFRVSDNDLYKARAAAEFVYNDLGLRRMAAIHDGDSFTSNLTAAFSREFRALGGDVAATAVIAKGDTDMTEALAQFAEAGPDGIFFPLFPAEGAPFARQARAFDGLEGAALVAGATLLVAGFLGAPESEGVYFAGPVVEFGANVNDATGKSAGEVLTAYEQAYGGPPESPYWAEAYDATTLLLSAIQRAAVRDDGNLFTRAIGLDKRGTLRIDRSDIRRAVREISNSPYPSPSGGEQMIGFPGLTGRLSCDEFGDCGTGRANIYQQTDTSVTDTARLPVVYRFEP